MSRTLSPTIRSSMWSTMPTPWRQPSSAARSSSATRPRRSPSIETGQPRSKPTRPAAARRAPRSGGVTSGRRRRAAAARGPRSPRPPTSGPRGCRRSRTGGASVPPVDRDPVLARVGDLLLAAHLPLAHRGDQLQLRVERRDRRLDPNLVVALAGAAVGDRVAARLARVLDRELGDQRPPERREQRIAAAVERVRLDRRQHVVARELLAGVDDDRVDGPEVARLAGRRRPSPRRAGRDRPTARPPRRRSAPGSSAASRWCRGRPSRAAARGRPRRGSAW